MNLSEKKVMVRKANVVLTISQLDVERYMQKGFDVIDGNGNIMQSATPNDPNVLQKAFNEHVAEITSLKAEIERLRAENAQLLAEKNVAEATKAEKSEEKKEEKSEEKTVEAEEAPKTEEAPKKTRKTTAKKKA